MHNSHDLRHATASERKFFLLAKRLVSSTVGALVVVMTSSIGRASECRDQFVAGRESGTASATAPISGPFFLKANPQIRIWQLTEAGRTEAAEGLREKVTARLARSPIVGFFESPNADATSATRLDFADGSSGLWKTANPKYTTPKEIQMEVVAYKFDRMTGANLVPITVERKFLGRSGVVQLFVRDTGGTTLIGGPRTLLLFDFLIAHMDRVGSNHLAYQGRTIAIDNEGTFVAGKKWSHMYPHFDEIVWDLLKRIANSPDKTAAQAVAIAEIAPSLISREFVHRLKTISDSEWEAALPELSPTRLKSLLARKVRAVAAIELAERVLGDAVYPDGAFSGVNRDRWPGGRERLQRLLDDDSKVLAMTPKMLKETQIALVLLRIATVRGGSINARQMRFVDQILEEIKSLP
jgi:hypothetical protein